MMKAIVVLLLLLDYEVAHAQSDDVKLAFKYCYTDQVSEPGCDIIYDHIPKTALFYKQRLPLPDGVPIEEKRATIRGVAKKLADQ